MIKIKMEPPNPKQIEFFKAKSRFVAYGGARGGGKSWAIRKKILLLGIHYPGINMLLLRRTYMELRENHIRQLQLELSGIAVYKEMDKSFTFANGSRLKCGYCDSESDVNQYQGQEYDIIFIDEATQFTEYQFNTLTACMRGANSFPKRMYLTCNPGGVGHAWVKRLFVERLYKERENAEDYTFIQAKVFDNKILMENDKGYVNMLENLPDKLREAWLNGNWDVFEGQYFSMFNRETHVLKPYMITKENRRYVAMDYGRDMFACYFIAVDEQNNGIVYKEIYQSDLMVSDAAKLLKSYILPDEIIAAFYAPPDLWNKQSQSGRSTAEIFHEHGINLTKVSNDRVQGWYDMAEWLKIVEDEQGYKTARLRIFDNCKNLIRCLPQVQYDDKNPNDVAKEPHELTHSVDAIRYFCAGRPLAYRPIPVEDTDYMDYDKQINSFLGGWN